jgi:hypothetical protein
MWQFDPVRGYVRGRENKHSSYIYLSVWDHRQAGTHARTYARTYTQFHSNGYDVGENARTESLFRSCLCEFV